MRRVGGDAGEDVREPGLWVDAVHFRGHDQAVHRRGALAAAVGAAEQPAFPAKGDAAQTAFCGIVRHADAPVVEEQTRSLPARPGYPPVGKQRHGQGYCLSSQPLGRADAVPGGRPRRDGYQPGRKPNQTADFYA